MSKTLYALGDCGGTQLREFIVDQEGAILATSFTETDPNNYEGTVNTFADMARQVAKKERGHIVAASMAVAAEVGKNGTLLQAGGLKPWVGKNPGKDIGVALNLSGDLVGTPNDMAAVAISQQYLNKKNGRPANGIVSTLSSGWGAALHDGKDMVQPDEPGHVFLRPGAECPGGGDGHTEAWISGNGVLKNQGVTMKEWLESPRNADTFVADVSTSVVAMLNRHEQATGFRPDEFRWMGGVAAHQQIIMMRANNEASRQLGNLAPAFDAVTMGGQAGLHGTFVDAQQRALAA